MYAIRQSFGRSATFGLTYALGHGFIGQEHKLFYQLIGILRTLEIGANGLALLVYIEVKFFAVELYSSVLKSLFAQFLGQLV